MNNKRYFYTAFADSKRPPEKLVSGIFKYLRKLYGYDVIGSKMNECETIISCPGIQINAYMYVERKEIGFSFKIHHEEGEKILLRVIKKFKSIKPYQFGKHGIFKKKIGIGYAARYYAQHSVKRTAGQSPKK